MQQIENVALKDVIYEGIKNMIANGEIPVGERINKYQLADIFHSSPTPINDALNRLVGENIIIQVPRKGFFVREFSIEEMCDIFAIRAGVEGIAARLCCESASDEEVRELSSMFSIFHLPLDEEQTKAYRNIDTFFHKKIVQYARNSYIAQTLKLTEFQAKSNTKGLVRPPEVTFAEHMRIAEALSVRDGNKAQEEMINHLLASRANLMKMLKK